MSQFAEKSILAKLLATENIHVEHQKTSTAYFNLETRTVVLPIFKEMSADLYDLLIGHEVGHALETPAQGWHSSISEKGQGFKSFLNIIEDARIERKMKTRYPGLRRSFYNGYKELFEQNFFGVEGMDVNKLKFIDRINLNAKVGSFLNIKFSPEEQAIVDRLDTLETWDDVVALATELYDRAEQSTEEYDFEQFLNQFQMDGDDDGEFDPTAEYIEVPSDGQANADKPERQAPPSKGQKSEDKSEDETKSSSSDSTEEKTEEKSDDSTEDSNSDGENQENIEPTSFTDENFRQNEDSLVDQSARETFYAKLPVLNPADYVIGINTVEKMLTFSVGGAASRAGKTAEQVKMELYKDFLAKNSKYLSAMAQDFERKKKAQSLMRAQTSKTGRINMDKVWAYKITEDLFLQNTVVPNGQNHGMLLYLDMSGSMNSNMAGTMEQLVLLASFCQKVRIPFEVYGFITNNGTPNEYYSSLRSRNDYSDPKNLVICDGGFRMLQLVATGVSGGKFKTQMSNLLALGNTLVATMPTCIWTVQQQMLSVLVALLWKKPFFSVATSLKTLRCVIALKFSRRCF
jgi:cobalamin biosynthesis protein CobT